MAMDPITWLLLVAGIISIYLAGIILSRIAWSRNRPQPPQEIQEPVEYPIELQPELEEASIQDIGIPAPEEVKPSPEPSVNASPDQVKEGQEPEEQLKEGSEKKSEKASKERFGKGSEERVEEPKIEEKIFKPYTPKEKELKRKDLVEMLETAQELKGELLRLKTILEKDKS